MRMTCFHITQALEPRRRASSRAFTLIEILVVISIIAVLLSIGIGVSSQFSRDTEGKKTTQVLDALSSALEEYGARTKGNYPAEDVGRDYPTDVFMESAYNDAREAYDMADKAITTTFLTDNDSDDIREFVVDSWEQPIRYVVTGDIGKGLPLHTQPYFASPGPDQEWGTIDTNNVRSAEAKDNLYSFEL